MNAATSIPSFILVVGGGHGAAADDRVAVVVADVVAALAEAHESSYDLVLLDAWKETYVPAFDALRARHLPGESDPAVRGEWTAAD